MENEVSISVPLSLIGASAGASLTNLRAHTSKEGPPLEAHVPIDELAIPDATLGMRQVSLGIAESSSPEDEVEFSTPAALESGRFSGTIDVSSLASGTYRIWARACLGDVCGSRSEIVEL